MDGGIFLSIKDLQCLLGCKHYSTALRQMQSIKDALGKKNKHITIKEYCESEDLDFKYIWEVLRGKQP